MIVVKMKGKTLSNEDKRNIGYTCFVILPLLFKLNALLSFLTKRLGIKCELFLNITDKVNLEVKNDR